MLSFKGVPIITAGSDVHHNPNPNPNPEKKNLNNI